MTQQQQIWIAAIVTTLAETNGSPAGMIYTAMGMDMQAWEGVRNLLVGAGLIKVTAGHFVTLTPEGEKVAAKIEEAVQSS